MTHDVRTSGIPALAYPQHAASPVSLSLFIKCNDRRAQMTLCLLSSLSLRGFDDAQTIVLQYDANNMMPGAISLGPATIPLPQDRLSSLARAGNPQIRTLSLKLNKECPVWCHPSTRLTPRPGCEALFHQLAELAHTRHVNILFDHNWLHRGLQASLQRLVGHPDELSGFPVGQRYREQRLKQVDWTVFSTEDLDTRAVAAATIEEGELPPDYAEASSKRPRQASTSPAARSPPRKRVLLSPYEEAVLTSPTEEGSTATPSPKRPHSAPLTLKFPPLAALNSLPHTPTAKANTAPPTSKPSSPAPPATDLHRAVDQAVSALLPTLVSNLLPRLLAATSPTPSATSPASQLSHAAPAPRLSALGITLHDRLASTLESEVSRLYAHTLSHANWLRSTADDRFAAMLEEERLALERVAEERFQECKERCDGVEEDVVERVGWKAEEIVGGVTTRLEEERVRLGREREGLSRDREELRAEKEELRRDREDLRLDKQELRREKDDLRREREDLRRERARFEAEKRQALRVTDSSTRAGSAPVQ